MSFIRYKISFKALLNIDLYLFFVIIKKEKDSKKTVATLSKLEVVLMLISADSKERRTPFCPQLRRWG